MEENAKEEINLNNGNIATEINLENNASGVSASALPAKVSIWKKMKDFLLQDVDQMQLIMTPKEQKFADFWCQEVTIDKVYNFMFKEIKFKK